MEADAESGEESDSDEDDGPQAQSVLAGVANAPKPPPGALHPSIGSETHALGMCKRCCFFSRGRCLNGYDCDFCHYEHDKRKRKNKKKRTKALGLGAYSRAGRTGTLPTRRERSGLAALLGRGDMAGSSAGLLSMPRQYQQSFAGAGTMTTAPASMLVQGCCEAGPGQQLIVYQAAPQALSLQCPHVAPTELLVAQQVFLSSAMHMETPQVLLQHTFPMQQNQQVAQAHAHQQAALLANPAPPPGQPPMLHQAGHHGSSLPPPPMQSPKLRQFFGAL